MKLENDYIENDCRKCGSSHRRCSVSKCVLRNFAKFTGKHLRQSLFFNFAKFLRTPFLQNASGRLLLKMTLGNGILCDHHSMHKGLIRFCAYGL